MHVSTFSITGWGSRMDKLVETRVPFWCGSEVADLLGLKLASIRQYAHRCEVGHKRGGIWWFTAPDIAVIKARMLPQE